MYVSQAEKIFATHSNYTTHSTAPGALRQSISLAAIARLCHGSSLAMSAAPTAVTT